jgi:hypothetical protein
MPRTRFVQTAADATSNPGRTFRDYNIEIHRGQVRRTIGRISGSPGAWCALPVSADAWSRWHRTRADALRALEGREDFRLPDTWIST